MKTRIIGDIHGDLDFYEKAIADCDHSIQVGDFGIGFGDEHWHERANKLFVTGDHRFIRGNHDSPSRCAEMGGWIPDMTVEGDVMFIGGAWSIDWAKRIEGISWWRDEELSPADFYRAIDLYEKTKPRVMITHDCPETVSKTLFVDRGIALGKTSIKTRTGVALQSMFEIHQPDHWFFGHWHHTVKKEIDGTTFHCLGINDFVDFDL